MAGLGGGAVGLKGACSGGWRGLKEACRGLQGRERAGRGMLTNEALPRRWFQDAEIFSDVLFPVHFLCCFRPGLFRKIMKRDRNE